MKPYEPFGTLSPGGRGWRIVVDELVVLTRIGLHAQEHLAPQPVAIDASLHYRGVPAEENAHELIDYEAWCAGVSDYLESKPHTRLLETLAVEIAELSFTRWPALDALTLLLYKPKIREGTRRVGVELDWHRADFDGWRASAALHTAARTTDTR
ncbi:Dihydroneopterin aldolase (plasmid) [Caballeronia sp. SBC1]|uniref:dihydroneopterin aldolase n=1 Tax=unclassified Caballeronia TaxID=2646786 RepID=UPI0013E14C2D|nr:MULTISPECIES: dihydroneopterin aldolase [unclassified Caballeronia]QIE27441.1 Dihydroneopterin aldolase [Caballeronia sp. SBC2]QIN65501.1 Dihydroneopterin aldolase [Caballeronia sp. SBC1]